MRRRVTGFPQQHGALLLLLIIGASLRFFTLGAQSFWFDEAQAALELQRSFGAMLRSLGSHETAPPLYFICAWLWTRVFGTGEVGLRALSALAGLATVALAYGCGRQFVSRRAGLVAALLVAINPFMIWYSQEAREYMLLAALSAACTYWFARSLRAGGGRDLSLWALFSALALLTHAFAVFVVWPEALWLLWALRRRRALLACLAVALVQLALLPSMLANDNPRAFIFITMLPLAQRIQQVPVAFALGNLSQTGIVSYGLLAAAVLGTVVLVLLVGASDAKELRGAGIAAALAACVLLLPLLAVVVSHDVYIARALIPAWVPLAVVVGAAVTARHARIAGALLAVGLTIIFLYGDLEIASRPDLQRPDWRGVAHALGRGVGPRVIVLEQGGELGTDPLSLYLRGVPWPARASGPIAVSEIDVVGNRFQRLSGPSFAGGVVVSSQVVDSFRIIRVRMRPLMRATPAQATARAAGLLIPAPPDPAVLVQGAA